MEIATTVHPSRRSAKTAAKRVDKREMLNMRIRPEVRSLIDQAAELAGKNRTEFVLDAARLAAQNTLLDRTSIALNKKAYAAFIALLDAPPQPNARLRKTLQSPAAWE